MDNEARAQWLRRRMFFLEVTHFRLESPLLTKNVFSEETAVFLPCRNSISADWSAYPITAEYMM
jgi:hypothetical protein